MARLLVDELDDRVIETLKRRAAKKGSTLEAEAREILTAAANQNRTEFGEWLRKYRSEQLASSEPESVELLRRDRARNG